MGLFGKKVKGGKEEREPLLLTREYRIFKRVEERPKNWFEKLNDLAISILKVKASEDVKRQIEPAVAFTGLRVTPESVMSLVILSIIFFIIAGVFSIFLFGIPIIGGIMVMALGFLVAYYFLKYPVNLAKRYRIKASSQIVLAILYMVVSMRISPNLERALKFASVNISGELALDLRKLLWDIEMRKYPSANEALDDYIRKWKLENEEFAEALRLIRDSQFQPYERAKTVLDQALTVVLEGTRTRMKHYAQDLKMPVMIIHMMGIILPVLGTIMAPLAAVFLSNLLTPAHFVLGYDIALPIIIIWFINNTLNKRPATFSQIDISKHPDLPKPGHFKLGKRDVPAWIFSSLIFLIFFLPGMIYFLQNPDFLVPPVDPETGEVQPTDPNPMLSLVMSSFIVMGIGFGLASYFFLSSFQFIKIQKSVQKIESEFELALFQLGNRVAGGLPTEVAMEYAIDELKDTEIVGLFQRTLKNMRTLGMTFQQALFDKNWGSLKYYPSRLVENIMYTIVDTAKKGIKYAAEGMLRIANYLKSIKETQEYIRELLSDTTSSMKFQAYFLTPMITGLIVAMTDVIVQVLVKLGEYLEGVGASQAMGVNFGMISLGAPSITAALFQLIVGVYLIEVVFILAMFLTKIEKGEDPISLKATAGNMIMIGLVFYVLIALFTSSMFGGLIKDALAGLGII